MLYPHTHQGAQIRFKPFDIANQHQPCSARIFLLVSSGQAPIVVHEKGIIKTSVLRLILDNRTNSRQLPSADPEDGGMPA